MATNITSAQTTINVPLSELPVGEHKGVWGGYSAAFIYKGVSYTVATEDDMPNPRQWCVITVHPNGTATIEPVRGED